MKRTIVILALVTAFVLAFSAVAQGTWRGFTPVRVGATMGTDATYIVDPIDATRNIYTDAADRLGVSPVHGSGMNGFITFPEARAEMARNLSATQSWIFTPNGDLFRPATAAEVTHYGAGTGPFAAGEELENFTVGMFTGNFRVGGAYAAFGHRAAEAAAIQSTAHGGYVTTTTKCVVCHSVHRATGLEDPDALGGINNPGNANQRNQNQAFLTAGANSCVECHVVWGSQPSRLLVEWGAPWGSYTGGGGPHAGPRRGCVMCHNAGIHGLTSSRFNVMNVFMLGNTRRPQNVIDNPAATAGRNLNWIISAPAHPDYGRVVAITPGSADNTPANAVAAFAAAIPPSVVTPAQITWFCRDTQIAMEAPLWTGADSRGNVAIQIPGGAGANDGNTWWYDGPRALGPAGSVPPVAGLSGVQYGAARSMATAYTCGEAGCHTTGAFFLTNWGVGKTRADSARLGIDQAAWNAATEAQREIYLATSVGDNMVRIGDVEVTGHVTPSTRVTQVNLHEDFNGGVGTCGPCHGGSPAGFPTASTQANLPDLSRRAYGCDQCHDMVGVATNTTAWPHGNRNIVVYEWTAAGQQLDAGQTLDTDGTVLVGEPNIARAGNLWMYAGSIARSADAPQLAGNPSPGALNSGTSASPVWNVISDSSAQFRGPNSINPFFADQSWFVMTNVGAGRYGVPSEVPANNWGTGLVDGSCLKCHVAIDSASMHAANSVAADAIRHTWNQGGACTVANCPNPTETDVAAILACPGNHNATVASPSWNGQNVTGSQRLFLYR